MSVYGSTYSLRVWYHRVAFVVLSCFVNCFTRSFFAEGTTTRSTAIRRDSSRVLSTESSSSTLFRIRSPVTQRKSRISDNDDDES